MTVISGVIALAVFAALLIAGLGWGYSASLTHTLPPGLVILSTTTGTVAAGYFCWALIHTLFDSFDGGVISFPIALVAALYGYGATTRCLDFSAKFFRSAAFCGFGAVALNYGIVAAMVQKDDGWIFLIYLLAGCGFWLCALVAALVVRTSREDAVGAAGEGDGYSRIPGSDRV
jgi:hypothetical protein